MQRMTLRITSFVVLFLAAFNFGCHRSGPLPGRGGEWLMMTQHERQIFVSAYLDGTGAGTSDLCKDLENNVVILKMKDTVAPSDHPCIHFRPQFTHGKTDALATYNYADPYVAIIDGFYKHSECRAMPYTAIMQHLNDAEFKSSEDLYRLVRSGDASWGAFSGFEGIEKCYGADRKR
ncbi:hypothetical protein HDF16_000726 [Granulicella aggregans]|uniref:Uncharacterized protein n=1 Tax=Granulicella aggregans TaxID=474949 RepID=A0A7W8E226_9BACT|nr:hypothetical protein [Granulicella aggregans]MBB5056057.1 hypothetical protein [Granulicella aggregans]